VFAGFRWQLLALLLSLLACGAAIAFRINRSSPPPSTAPTPSLALATSSPSPTATDSAALPPSATRGGLSGSYREGIVGRPQRLNPLLAQLNAADRDISSLIFEGLFRTNAYGELVPQLAEEHVISSDGLEHVLRLRQDVLWQDGLPFGADDVLYTVSLLSSPAYAAISLDGAFWQTVEAQKLSPQLLRFRLAQPHSGFTSLLTVGILPEHALRGTGMEQLAGHPFNLSPVGTGPYQLAQLFSDGGGITALELARSPLYSPRGAAAAEQAFERLRFQFYADEAALGMAFRAGEIDTFGTAAPPSLPDLLGLPSSQLYHAPLSQLTVLLFNWVDSPFAERRWRQALALSLDLPRLVQAHMAAGAVPADGPFAPGFSVHQPNSFWREADMGAALALLENLPTDDGAQELAPLSLVYEGRPALQSLAHDIADTWQTLGLQFELLPLSGTELAERLAAGRFHAAIVEQAIGADWDLFPYWHPSQARQGNVGGVSQVALAELLEAARSDIYAVRRFQSLHKLQTVFAEQAIAIPLFAPTYTFVTRDSLSGIQLSALYSPADRFRGILSWGRLAASA